MLKGVRKSRSTDQYPSIHMIHGHKRHTHKTHNLLPPQETCLDLCSSLEITGASLSSAPPAERKTLAFQNIRPMNGFMLSPWSRYKAFSHPSLCIIKCSLFLMASRSHSSERRSLSCSSCQERRHRRRWGRQWRQTGKEMGGNLYVKPSKGKSDQMSQSKCFALMTSPEESCGAFARWG